MVDYSFNFRYVVGRLSFRRRTPVFVGRNSLVKNEWIEGNGVKRFVQQPYFELVFLGKGGEYFIIYTIRPHPGDQNVVEAPPTALVKRQKVGHHIIECLEALFDPTEQLWCMMKNNSSPPPLLVIEYSELAGRIHLLILCPS